MTITTISSREFNQDTSGAIIASQQGPVYITDRGRPAHVLLCMEEYQRLTGLDTSIVDLLVMPETTPVEFEPERAVITPRPVDF